MILEAVENRCIEYLGQVVSPLVPVSRLLRFVTQADACEQVSEEELLAFLRPHPLFKVIDPMEAVNGSGEPQVTLASRIPSQAELTAQMQEQLLKMLDALEKAEHEAEANADVAMREQIRATRLRAEMLQQQINDSI